MTIQEDEYMKKQILRLFIAILACFSLHAQNTPDLSNVGDYIPNVKDLFKQIEDAKKIGHGFGFLQMLNNQTAWQAEILLEDDPPISKALPQDTIITIKSKSKNPKYANLYYTLKQNKDGALELKPTTKDLKDPDTQFIIKRYTDANINDWFGFTHAKAGKNVMRYNSDASEVTFDTSKFEGDDNVDAHWIINGKSIENCWIINRKTKGYLTTTSITRDVPVEGKEGATSWKNFADTEVWGTNTALSYFDYPKINPPGGAFSGGESYHPKQWYESWQLPEPGNGIVIFDLTVSYRNDGAIFGAMGFASALGGPTPDYEFQFAGGGWAGFGIRSNVLLSPANSHQIDNKVHRFAVSLDKASRMLTIYQANVPIFGWVGAKDPNFKADVKYFSFREAWNLVSVDNICILPNDGSQQVNNEMGKTMSFLGPAFSLTPLPKVIYRITEKNLLQVLGKDIVQVSLRNEWDETTGSNKDTIAYGVDINNHLQYWNGSSWSDLGMKVKYVSLGAEKGEWCVNMDGTIGKKSGTSWPLIPSQPGTGNEALQVAAVDDQIAWCITKNKVYHYDKTGQWVDTNFPGGTPTSISVASKTNFDADPTPEVWATNQNGDVFVYETTWGNKPRPAEGLMQVAVRSEKEVYGVSKTHNAYKWDGQKWSQIPGLQLGFIAVASFKFKQEIAAKTEKKQFEITTTSDATDLNDTLLEIEVVPGKRGMGGGIASHTTLAFGNIPVTKTPRVNGFAQYNITDFGIASLLQVSPLRSEGAAWLTTSLTPPNKTTVTFLARPQDAGDIQFILGEKISESFVYKVVIGGWGNTKSAIIKRTQSKDGKDVDTNVLEVTPSNNPLAAASAGNMTPYWVSYNNGLFLVGMGNQGENVFMAWRDPNPSNAITRIGFGSHTTPVDYMQVQVLPPVVVQPPKRIYIQDNKPLTVSASKGSLTWTTFPFRVEDRGTIGFDIKGSEQVVLALGKEPNIALEHYAIIFGYGKNEGILINKWDPKTKKYYERSSFPNIALKADTPIPFWVSYNYGQFIIGQGNIGENVLIVMQDINPYSSIDAIGFGAWGAAGAEINNIKIASASSLDLEQATNLYKRTSTNFQFSGGIDIILPFEYTFSQNDKNVQMFDGISGKRYLPLATPEPATHYKFNCTIQEDGTPQLALTEKPDNPIQLDVQRAVGKADAQQALNAAQADMENQKGEIAKGLATASGDKERAGYDARMKTFEAINTAGQAIIQAAAGGDPIIGSAALGIGSGMIGGTAVGTALAEKMLNDAAAQDFQGAQSVAEAQKRALQKTSDSAQLQFASSLLQGEANFAFTGSDNYLYVDTAKPEILGQTSIPDEATKNADLVSKKLDETNTLKPLTKATFDQFIADCQDIIFLANHFFVVKDPFVKKKLYDNIEDLYKTYEELYGKLAKPPLSAITNIMNILFTARNNTFIVNADDPSEKKTKDIWYTYINEVGRKVLSTSNEIEADKFYGEYLWVPTKLPADGNGSVSFEVKGLNDAFIAFSKELKALRNSEDDMYEIDIGGWENSKSVIRIQSLGKSVVEFVHDDKPETKLNPLDFEQYWINVNNGIISVGKGPLGQNQFLTWKDPYPIKGLTYVGISSWDAPVTYRNIKVGPPVGAKGVYKKSTKKPLTSIQPIATAIKASAKKTILKKQAAPPKPAAKKVVPVTPPAAPEEAAPEEAVGTEDTSAAEGEATTSDDTGAEAATPDATDAATTEDTTTADTTGTDATPNEDTGTDESTDETAAAPAVAPTVVIPKKIAPKPAAQPKIAAPKKLTAPAPKLVKKPPVVLPKVSAPNPQVKKLVAPAPKAVIKQAPPPVEEAAAPDADAGTDDSGTSDGDAATTPDATDASDGGDAAASDDTTDDTGAADAAAAAA